jgi:UDP-N-acetylmuramyl pentapeptide synthase
VKEILNVKLNSSFENVEICNLLGQIIYTSQIIDTHNFSIDVSGLKQGIYFIRLKGKSGVFAKKFIKE